MTVPADTSKAVKQRARGGGRALHRGSSALSHAIHENPGSCRGRSTLRGGARHGTLREAGFAVEVGAYDIPTAVEAVYGDGDLTVTVCAE